MRNIIIACILILFLSTFVFAESRDIFKVIKIGNTEGVIVPAKKGRDFYGNNEKYGKVLDKYWVPSEEDLLNSEIKLVSYLKDNKPSQSPDLWNKLQSYKRQYLGIVINGEKKIWINFFNKDHVKYDDNWKEQPVYVEDGGDDFFSIMYDLKTESFSDLNINGEA